jgi:zinc protease
MLPGITLDEVNAAVKQAIPAGQNKLVVYMGSDHGDVPPPQANALLAEATAAEQVAVKAQVEKVYASKLMEQPPKAGRIVKQSVNKALGLTMLTLSNGVKVVLKPTDFKNDQVLMSSARFGGQSLFGDQDILNARYASTIVAQMGLASYTPTDLQKVLAGKVAGASVAIGNLSEGVSGNSSSEDVETMLQLAYLKLTDVRKDDALYTSFIGKQQELARNAMSRPEAVFNDTIVGTLYNNDPRVARVPRPEDFDHIQLDRVLDIYRSRLSSAKDFTFFLVGSFDVEKIKPLIATYLGSLPAGDVAVKYKDLGIRPVKGVVKKDVYKGSEAKSTVSLTFTGDAPYSEDEHLRLQAMIDVLNIKLTESLREQKSLIYGGGAHGALAKIPYGNYSIGISLPCGPENVDKVIAATFDEIRKLQQDGPALADLNKVKANWTENHLKAMRENGYWLGQLQSAAINGTDPAALLTVQKRTDALTTADLKAAAQRYFKMDNYLQVVLYPEKAGG